jgi:circadian clock protein KaiC
VTGAAGTGKTTVASQFTDAACRRGERCVYFAMEESRDQILRNMRAVGIDLAPHVASGMLRFHCTRPTLLGLEAHLASMLSLVREFEPAHVVLDPITSFADSGVLKDVKIMSMRLIDLLKTRTITAYMTSLIDSQSSGISSEVAISSLIDTWLLLRELESDGVRRRGIYVLKSRGIKHSHQVREFEITDHGIQLAGGGADGGNGRSRATRNRSPEGR